MIMVYMGYVYMEGPKRDPEPAGDPEHVCIYDIWEGTQNQASVYARRGACNIGANAHGGRMADYCTIRLRDTVPNKAGEYLMVQYIVKTSPRYEYVVPGAWSGLHIEILNWNARYSKWCQDKRILIYRTQIRDRSLIACIKLYMQLNGFASMTADEFIDTTLGANFRKEYRLTTMITYRNK